MPWSVLAETSKLPNIIGIKSISEISTSYSWNIFWTTSFCLRYSRIFFNIRLRDLYGNFLTAESGSFSVFSDDILFLAQWLNSNNTAIFWYNNTNGPTSFLRFDCWLDVLIEILPSGSSRQNNNQDFMPVSLYK